MTFEEWYAQHPDFNGWEPSQQEHEIWDGALKYGIPEGYVLVPVEPTEAMVEEGEIAYVHGGTIEAVYKAIIQAAQEEE